MQMADTFLGWNACGYEGTWTLDEGHDYPRLWWEFQTGGPLGPAQLSDALTGSGTEDDPLLVHTPEELLAICLFACDWDKHFKLMSDIDLGAYAGMGFTTIGWRGVPFTGVFDGNGHTISNFTPAFATDTDAGLFGYVDDPNAEIRNLGLVDPNLTASASHVGPLVGYLREGTVAACAVRGGTVTGWSNTGGLVGYNYEGIITHCYSTAMVHGTGSVGGLVGENRDGTIIRCYSTGFVSGDYDVGGLVGDDLIGYTTRSFWNIETSGQISSEGGTGLTTGEMMTAAPFVEAGWDLAGEDEDGTEDIWWIDQGRDCPRLWWEETDAEF
jgi:hypothetical protein